jgi:O-antigen ligase
MECVKWPIILVGIICAVSAIFYFWLTGKYTRVSLKYLGILMAEIAVFLIISKIFIKKDVVV